MRLPTAVLLLAVPAVSGFAAPSAHLRRGPPLAAAAAHRRGPRATAFPLRAAAAPSAEDIARAGRGLRRVSSVSWWLQAVPTGVATATLLFAALFESAAAVSPAAFRATAYGSLVSSGLLFSATGLLLSFTSIAWQARYKRVGLVVGLGPTANPTGLSPIRAKLRRLLKLGVYINLAGTAITLISAGQTVGALLGRLLSAPTPGAAGGYAAAYAAGVSPLQPLDLFVVQANTNVLLSHYFGLITALWLRTKNALAGGVGEDGED